MKRFYFDGKKLREDGHGPWVQYDDAAALEAKVDSLNVSLLAMETEAAKVVARARVAQRTAEEQLENVQTALDSQLELNAELRARIARHKSFDEENANAVREAQRFSIENTRRREDVESAAHELTQALSRYHAVLAKKYPEEPNNAES